MISLLYHYITILLYYYIIILFFLYQIVVLQNKKVYVNIYGHIIYVYIYLYVFLLKNFLPGNDFHTM